MVTWLLLLLVGACNSATQQSASIENPEAQKPMSSITNKVSIEESLQALCSHCHLHDASQNAKCFSETLKIRTLEKVASPVFSDHFDKFQSLFPSGGEQLTLGDDDVSNEFTLDIPVMFYSELETKLFVSSNGIISFNKPFEQLIDFSTLFGEERSTFREPVIAPLWIDLAPGSIFFRETSDSAVLSRVSALIAEENPGFAGFRPTQAVIITWDHIPVFANQSLIVSVQVVLVTDGRSSFALFIYDNPELIQQLRFEIADYVLIGFNKGDGRTYTVIPQQLVQSINIYRIDGVCITGASPDSCSLDSVALLCDHVNLTAQTCLCDNQLVHSQSSRENKCLENFYPFGIRSGDNSVSRDIDGMEKIKLPETFRFFPDTTSTIICKLLLQRFAESLQWQILWTQSVESLPLSIQVSTNGFVSFSEITGSHHVAQFPSSSFPLIAPLAADFDFRDSGTVYYRVIEQNCILVPALAEKIHSLNPDLRENFEPSMCVIVTWHEATLFSASENQLLTFQLVLATDGRASFAFFIYQDIEAVVNVSRSLDVLAVGFDAGDRRRSATLRSSQSRNFDLESVNVFRVDGNCITEVSPDMMCDLNSTSLDCAADSLTATSCFCAPGTTNLNTTNCRLANFFPFGVDNNDEIGPQEIDRSFLFNISVPIVFYQTEYTSLYISTNGLISLSEPFDFHIHDVLPRYSPPYVPLIAPFWADFNFRDAGAILYRETDDPAVLKLVERRLASSGFSPSMAVVVTWFQSQLLDRHAVTSFQAVLATNGRESYAIFVYDDFSSFDFDDDYRGGFDAGNRQDGVRFNLYDDFYTQINNLLFSADDYGSDGSYAFRIDGNCITYAEHDTCGANSTPIICEGTDFPERESCLWRSGYQSEVNNTESFVYFLPFGGIAGDRFEPSPEAQTRRSSVSVSLSVPITYYGQSYSELKISTEGFISFGEVVSEYTPLPQTEPVIAPAWLENPDATPNYRSSFYYRRVQDQSTLSSIAALISESNTALGGFQPEEAVVVTWFIRYVLEYQEYFAVQCILTSSGNTSFAIFLYESPEKLIEPATREEPARHQVGFDSGDGERHYIILQDSSEVPVSQSRLIFRIDGYCVTSADPGHVCGLNSVSKECESQSSTAAQCSCNTGYTPQDNTTCVDINECEILSPFPCEQLCINTTGSYYCDCFSGYELHHDGVRCENIDECATTNRSCEMCEDTDGSFECKCRNGYSLSLDNGSCQDIDECEDSPCGNNANCTNTDGSYVCSCHHGFSGNPNTGCLDNSLLSAVIGGSVSAAIVLVLIIVAAIIVIVLRVHAKKQRRRLRFAEDNDYIMNWRRLLVQSSFRHNLPKSLIIPSCNLQLGNTIGQGEFGIVYRGQRKNSFADKASETVAVKTLKGFVERNLVEDLLRECAKMQQFNHPNVLKLSGVCLDGGPAPYVIMPFMANGSLLSYLKQERTALMLDPNNTDADEAESVLKKLLDMSIQVAKGMEYLASKRVIHRDLAARNCMIDQHFVIKVADFGLSESVDVTKEYYRQEMKNVVKLPIKWLAPECINDGLFSEKSDVWSYGVTCWEIFSAGKTPYPGIHPAEIPHQLEIGYRMKKPHNAACSDDIFMIMMNCWDSQPDKRPYFSDLVRSLSSCLVVMAEYMDFSPNSTTALVSPHKNGSIQVHRLEETAV